MRLSAPLCILLVAKNLDKGDMLVITYQGSEAPEFRLQAVSTNFLEGTRSAMYAIVKTGGKQYTVRENELIQVDKMDVPVGEPVVLNDVLFVSGDKGISVGTPKVEGAQITAKVVRHGKAKKIVGFTYKPKKNEHRRYGHRQQYTQVLIQKISE